MTSKGKTRLQEVVLAELKKDRRAPYRVIVARVKARANLDVSEGYVGTIARANGLARSVGLVAKRSADSVAVLPSASLSEEYSEGSNDVSTDSVEHELEHQSFEARLERTCVALGISPPGQTFIDLVSANEPAEMIESNLFGSHIKETLAVLSAFKDDDARRVAAICSEEPNLLALLATDKSETVRLRVAMNSCTPLDSLVALSSDEYFKVRKFVAGNTATPASLLSTLRSDEAYPVRASVARCSSSEDDLVELSTDENELVLLHVAGNTAAPPDVLANLSSFDGEVMRESVRQTVAQNPKTPPDALRGLLNDKEQFVVYYALSNPSSPPDKLTEMVKGNLQNIEICMRVAYNPRIPQGLEDDLVFHESSDVREMVARNPSAPPNVLMTLMNDKDLEVRCCLAHNPSISAHMRDELRNDRSVRVRDAAEAPDFRRNFLASFKSI